MKRKKIKGPKTSGSQHIQAPQWVDHRSTNHTHPAFCFRYTHRNFSVNTCDKEFKSQLAVRLEELSRMSWAAIQKAPRKGNGHEKIPQHAIKVAIPPNTPKDRNYLAFRLGHAKNAVIVGYRNGEVFYIIWVDPHGKVYSHGR